jgi:hypothetical protein
MEPLVEILDVSQKSSSPAISASYIERPILGTAWIGPESQLIRYEDLVKRPTETVA